jgi:ATPase family protein associated with various cellular activities (AAA)
MTGSTTAINFEELYALKQFVDQLRQQHVASLRVYAEADPDNGFKSSEAAATRNRISISSSATCVGSLILSGVWDTATDAAGTKAWWVGREEEFLKRLLRVDWTSADLPSNNAYTTAFVIEAVSLLEGYISKKDPTKLDQILNERVQFGDDDFKKKKTIGIPQSTDYRTLLSKATDLLHQSLTSHRDSSPREAYIAVLEYPPSGYLTQLATRALRSVNRIGDSEGDNVANWAAREITAQTALIQADSKNADPLQLIYLIICLASFRSKFSETPNELDLIRYGLEVFFKTQKPDGSWPLSRPLFHYPTTGSAYCYDYEALAQLLLCQPLYNGLFEFMPAIQKATFALDKTKFNLTTGGYGWASNHHPQSPGPESWSTASVYLYLFALDRFIAEGIRRSIAQELELPYIGVRRTQDDTRQFASKFLDCPRSAKDSRSLKDAFYSLLVRPIADASPLVAKGQKLPDGVPVSAILFGPPGTSKTEIIDQISDYIGWPAFAVDPSYFVQGGLDAIQAQANKIFRMLSAAEEIIVLFDEFDEMVRNRANADEAMSRFLTTAMLPKLAKINKQRRIIFIVATNFIDTFDVAISRAGRFDYVIQMMPPTAEAKIKAPNDGATKEWAETLTWIKAQLNSSGFDNELADLTFLETKSLVAKVSSHRKIDEKALVSQLNAIWAEALSRCTLRRPEINLPTRDAEAAATNDSIAPRDENWTSRSRDQTRFIRFDD